MTSNTSEPKAAIPARVRRGDRLGVHSIAEFVLTVPSLGEAARFYAAFGLRVEESVDGLKLRAAATDHIWGRVVAGPRKKLAQLTFHCFENELELLHARAIAIGSNPTLDASGMWLNDPDGVLLLVRPGPKVTPDSVEHQQPPLPVNGIGAAPYRRKAQPALPQRLSHLMLLTRSVQTQVDFYTGVLGLQVSDRAGNGVAFLHGPHGSDHHLLALATSDGSALHHLSWDVPTVEDVALGMMRLQAAGYHDGWGVGRHVLGSNYFYYARDPWGSFCELSAQMDFIPAQLDWKAADHPAEDGLFLWGPPIFPGFLENSEPLS